MRVVSFCVFCGMALTLRLFGGAGRLALAQTAAVYQTPYNEWSNSRNMATLKEVKARIKSVTSIQKITKSMKLVATTRLKKAEEAFEKNKPSLLRMDEFLTEMKADAVETPATEDEGVNKSNLVVCLTTERGLCGSVNRYQQNYLNFLFNIFAPARSRRSSRRLLKTTAATKEALFPTYFWVTRPFNP